MIPGSDYEDESTTQLHGVMIRRLLSGATMSKTYTDKNKIGFPKSILVIVVALLSLISPAFSHAILLSSTPRSEDIVTGMETFIE